MPQFAFALSVSRMHIQLRGLGPTITLVGIQKQIQGERIRTGLMLGCFWEGEEGTRRECGFENKVFSSFHVFL